MELKVPVQTVNIIEETSFSSFVKEIYGRPYRFQQQMGCLDRGVWDIEVPCEDSFMDIHEEIEEKINGPEECVTFEKWLERDPKKPVGERKETWEIQLFWERNFYPDLSEVLNDLHKKGYIEAGKYKLNIDW